MRRVRYVGTSMTSTHDAAISSSFAVFVLLLSLSGALGGVIGAAPMLGQPRPRLDGVPPLENSYLPPSHSLVWPGVRIPETASARLERLEVPSLEGSKAKSDETAAAVRGSSELAANPPTATTVAKGGVPSAEVLKNRHLRRAVAGRKPGEISTGQGLVIPLHVRLLDQIRSDPNRIYVDEFVKLGSLSFGVRNVSPQYGIEVWVSADEYLSSPVYYPKARVGHVEADFEGQMVTPGQKYFGSVPMSDLKSKKSVNINFSAAGVPEKKVTVKLKW